MIARKTTFVNHYLEKQKFANASVSQGRSHKLNRRVSGTTTPDSSLNKKVPPEDPEALRGEMEGKERNIG